MGNYNNRTAAIIDLHKKGYDKDFVLKDEHILYVQYDELIDPDELEIMETYRFEEKSAFKNCYVIYAIRLAHEDIKGILMTSYQTLINGKSIFLWTKLADKLK